MTQAKYGIFLPVRNGAAYIQEAIDSVVAQTHNDWILVVLDNASSDGSAELASAYRHPNIQVHRSATDLPIWESWHRVLTLLAAGSVEVEYATIIGHDDQLLPTFLEAIEQLITEHPKASLYQTAFDIVDARGALIRPCRPIPAVESSTDFLAARLWGLRDSVGTGYVFRPGDYVAAGGMPNLPFLLHADDLLFARLARITFKATCRSNQCLYRLHRESTSHRLSSTRIEGHVAAIEQYVSLLYSSEFPGLLGNRSGNLALACFLAREILILRPLANELLLSAQTCQRIKRLEATYHLVAEKIDYRQWLGTNFVSRIVYAYSKQLMLFYVLLRSKLASGH